MSQPLLQARVRQLRYEASNIISIELVPVDNDSFPAFTAGAHIDLHLAPGLVRSYSLLNSQAETSRYVLGVLNDSQSKGGSRFVHEQLRVGAAIQIGAPRNNFELDEGQHETVLFAGGIGVTPILSMYRRLTALGRSVSVVYCARERSGAAFVDQFHPQDVRCHFDDEHGNRPFDLVSFFDLQKDKGAHVYCCGPTPMINAFEAAASAAGMTNVHVERFAADTKALAEAQKATGSYTVVLNRSGRSITVPAGTSILDAMIQSGVECSYSCRDGVCGSCETTVIEGQVDHRDLVLTDKQKAESKTMMICVSALKAGSERLVLDM